MIYVNSLTQCLAQSKHSINDSYSTIIIIIINNFHS